MTTIETINTRIEEIENILWDLNMADRLTLQEKQTREALTAERRRLYATLHNVMKEV